MRKRQLRLPLLSMPNTDERRAIPGWEGLYEITRHGQVWSVRSEEFMSYTPSTSHAPYIEVSIHGTRHRKSISRATMDAWGTIEELTAEQRRWFDTDAIQLFDHLVATYRPQRQWRTKMRRAVSEVDYGKRGLLQVVGKIGAVEVPGAVGEWALMPRESGWAWHRYPLPDFRDIEPAPPGAGKYDLNAAMRAPARARGP